MIKLVYVVTARDDIAPDEFRRYWLEEHGPLVASLAGDIRARKYTQSHTVISPLNDALVASRGMAQFHDGITEVWFDNIEDLQEAFRAPKEPERRASLPKTKRSSSTSAGRRSSSPRSTTSSTGNRHQMRSCGGAHRCGHPSGAMMVRCRTSASWSGRSATSSATGRRGRRSSPSGPRGRSSRTPPGGGCSTSRAAR